MGYTNQKTNQVTKSSPQDTSPLQKNQMSQFDDLGQMLKLPDLPVIEPLMNEYSGVITQDTSLDQLEVMEGFDLNYHDTLDLGISTKTLQTTFGREEDYIELHIQNTEGHLVYSETNFQDFELNGSKNAISINAEKILSNRGYISGQYILKLHIFRNNDHVL